MGIACTFGSHKWDGCKCLRCGKTRDEEHAWDGCTCTVCGKTRDEEHDWSKDQEKCARCGRTRTVCSICGAELKPEDAEEHKAKCLIHQEICDLPGDAVLLVVARVAQRIIAGWSFSSGGYEEEAARFSVLELYVSCIGRLHDDDRLARLEKQIDGQRMNALGKVVAMGVSSQRMVEACRLGLLICSADLSREAFSKNELDRLDVADQLAKLVLRARWLAKHFGTANYDNVWTELMADLSSVGKIAQEQGWKQDSKIDIRALDDLMILPEQVLLQLRESEMKAPDRTGSKR